MLLYSIIVFSYFEFDCEITILFWIISKKVCVCKNNFYTRERTRQRPLKRVGAKKTKRNIAKNVTARLALATRRRAQQSAAAAPF
jgi:hypothetical protein